MSEKIEFQYTELKWMLTYAGVIVGLFFTSLILLAFVEKTIQDRSGLIIFVTFIPSIIYGAINWKHRKKFGSGEIKNDSFTLRLKGKTYEVPFLSLVYYKIEFYNGTAFRFKTGKEKVKVLANSTFCNPDRFTIFTRKVEEAIISFQNETKKEIRRKKAFQETRIGFVVLILLTFLGVGAFIYMIFFGEKTSGAIYVALGSVVSLWYGYFILRKRRKQIEFKSKNSGGS